MGSQHKDLTLDENHAIIARTYANIAARDADSAFNTATANLNKLVRVDSPLTYFILEAITPSWLEFSATMFDEFIELLDTPSSYSGAGAQLVQVNSGGTALEFTPAPTAATDLLVGAARPITTDAGIELRSTTKAMLLPRLTTTQRDALTAVAGFMVFNVTDSASQFFSGSGWVSMAAGGGDVVGPASAPDNALVRFNSTTGKIIKRSDTILTDAEVMTGLTGLSVGTSSAPTSILDVIDPRTQTANLLDTLKLRTGNAPSGGGLAILWQASDVWDMARIGVRESAGFGGNIVFETNLGQDLITAEVMRITAQQTVGIGTTAPDNLLDVHSATAEAAIAITSLGTDMDALIRFEVTTDGVANYSMGVDDSDGDKFKIGSTALTANTFITLDTAGLSVDINGINFDGVGGIARLSGGDLILEALAGSINVANSRITNVLDPTGALDAANMRYVDAADFWVRSGTTVSPETAGDNVGIGVSTTTDKLEVDGVIRITSDNGNNLFIGKMNESSSEGGRLLLEGGAVANDTWIIDSFFDNLRLFTTSVNANFVVMNNTNVTGVCGLKVEGNTFLGNDTGIPLSTLDVSGTAGFKRVGTGASVATANEIIIGVTDTSAVRTITLQTIDAVAGRIYIIKDESGAAGTNNIIIATQGSETIDGDSTLVIASNYGGAILYSDNVNWFVAAKT